jgi:hypothetical protein
MVPVVDCGPPESQTRVEATILRLTSAVKELQHHSDSTDSEAVRVLLMDAQEELLKLSSKCSNTHEGRCDDEYRHVTSSQQFCQQPVRFSEEEDLALLQTIPLQDLLGTCFEQHKLKDSRPSSGCISSVSTMSSLGGSSPQTWATPASRASCEAPTLSTAGAPPTRLDLRDTCRSPRPTLPCMKSDNAGPSSRQFGFRTSCLSPRPTLPCRTSCGSHMHSGEIKTSASVKDEGTLPKRMTKYDNAIAKSAGTLPLCLTKYDYSSKPMHGGGQVSKSAIAEWASATVLTSVVPIEEEGQEQESDAWELEFLRRSMLD